MLARLLVSPLLALPLLLSPASAQLRPVRPPPTTPIEVAARIVRCMEEDRQSTGGGVVAAGSILAATISQGGVPVATLQRRAFDPATEPWLTHDPIQPPLVLDLTSQVDTDDPAGRETARYLGNCFALVYPP